MRLFSHERLSNILHFIAAVCVGFTMLVVVAQPVPLPVQEVLPVQYLNS